MRLLPLVPPLLLVLALAGCGGDPASLGITGAGVTQFPPDPGQTSGVVASPTSGDRYDPSAGPNTGAGKFWGYN